MSLARAQMAFDGSLGPVGALAGPDFEISAAAGRQVGGNLFHSFQHFNVHSGESATFTGPASVETILGRVTGGEPSTVDGLLRSAIPGADVYLMNPAGVVLGPNAQLDIDGSFHATTAHYLEFQDGGRFGVDDASGSGLSVAPVAAFGFVAPPSPLAVTGSQLALPPGQTLGLIGGDIALTGGILQVPEGALDAVAVAGRGRVDAATMAVADFAALGAIELGEGTVVDVSGPAGGRVRLRAESATLANATVAAATGDGVGQGIDVQVRGPLTLGLGGRLVAEVQGAGAGGPLRVEAGQLLIDGRGGPPQATGLFADTLPEPTGGGGGIDLAVGELVITDGVVNSQAFGAGLGGDVSINAQGVALTATAIDPQAISTAVGVNTTTLSLGDGGDLNVTTETLTIAGRAGLSAGSSGPGVSGNISVTAGDIAITGPGFNIMFGFTGGISTASFLGGDAGDIAIDVGRLTLRDGNTILGAGVGESDGGDITVTAGTLLLDGGDAQVLTAIAAPSAGTGRGGTIRVSAERLELHNRGGIAADTLGSGPSGDLIVEVGQVLIDGNGTDLSNGTSTGLSVGTFPGSTGVGGDLVLRADRVEIRDGGGINATAQGMGTAGTITIDTQTMVIDAESKDAPTVIVSVTQGGGPGGDIFLRTDGLEVRNGGLIIANTVGGAPAGAIAISADQIDLDGGTIVSSTSGSGAGGAITISAQELNLTGASAIRSSADENTLVTIEAPVIDTGTGFGPAGAIALTVAEELRMEAGSGVLAQAVASGGGNFAIDGGSVALRGAVVDAAVASGVEGG
ncbi:MAG: filamentous hemagglutinin N-terminal domain-containing protein, partial [Candidatus Competibacterales bacterium]